MPLIVIGAVFVFVLMLWSIDDKLARIANALERLWSCVVTDRRRGE